MNITVGDKIKFKRTFTEADVELFTKVSMDEGDHHTTPDELGRLVVQGLLTALRCRQKSVGITMCLLGQ